jgi:hypothetical protein
MAIEARIRELSARHRDLDVMIESEERAPASDAIYVATLKRQKLRLKEEIETLRRQH